MNTYHLMTFYLSLHLLVVVSYLSLKSFTSIKDLLNLKDSSLRELKINYFFIAMTWMVSLTFPMLPQESFFVPSLKSWDGLAGQISKISPYTLVQNVSNTVLDLATPYKEIQDNTHFLFSLLITSLFLFSLFSIFYEIVKIIKMKRFSYLIKKAKGLSIFVSHAIEIPFSFWLPGMRNVFIPEKSLNSTKNLRIIIAHELQHHRQQDTKWIYLIHFMKIFLFPNLFIHLWIKDLNELQEFACDEALIGRKKTSSLQYSNCLLEMAESLLRTPKEKPACATGLIFNVQRKLLMRRIKKMTTLTSTLSKRWHGLFIILATCFMVMVAHAAQNLVSHRVLSLDEAEILLKNANERSQKLSPEREHFPLVINDLVLEQLNKYIGTPAGRKFMRNALYRMGNYQEMITQKIDKYNLPIELMAIPIVESGYQNLKQQKPQWGAGIWMAIKSTARAYGLKVNDKIDERLNPELLTDMALRLLKADDLRFSDWLLAVQAYNMGEGAVQKAIDQEKTRDVWELIRKGHEGDSHYLAKVIATMIIMNNPESVQDSPTL